MPANGTLETSPKLPDKFVWNDVNHDCRTGFRPCVIAGVRPKRLGGYRLELKTESGVPAPVCHNYGHGGAGITMSWGCAEQVCRLLKAAHPPSAANTVAVIGAGVMGLTAAAVLLGNGYRVKIYAKATSPDTTSDKAGGQWSPSAVEHRPGEVDEFDQILIDAHRKFSSLLNKGYGVYERSNYVHWTDRNGRKGELSESFKKIPDGLVNKTKLAKLPFNDDFAHYDEDGWQVDTLLVEPTVFMTKLMADLEQKYNVKPEIWQFKDKRDLARLSEKVIVNCTGFGARDLFDDPQVKGVEGQLLLLPPQPQLKYLFSAGNEYVFPRSDALVVGGSFVQTNRPDATPTQRTCRNIWLRNKNLFGARRLFVSEGFVSNAIEYVSENMTIVLNGNFGDRNYYEIDGVRYTDF